MCLVLILEIELTELNFKINAKEVMLVLPPCFKALTCPAKLDESELELHKSW